MKAVPRAALVPALWAVLSWACAGDGAGLDEHGVPIGRSGLPLAPSLSSLQRNIFTPICSACHTGESAPLGLALDAGLARQNLVGARSAQIPALLRVNPGKPDSSYLVWKIEGRAGILGGRMPLGGAPLSAEQVATVHRWIQDGAPNN